MPVYAQPDHSPYSVRELIEALQRMPQDAPVMVEADYGHHHCAGVRVETGRVWIEIG